MPKKTNFTKEQLEFLEPRKTRFLNARALKRYPEFFGETYALYFDLWRVQLPEDWEPVIITVPEGEDIELEKRPPPPEVQRATQIEAKLKAERELKEKVRSFRQCSLL